MSAADGSFLLALVAALGIGTSTGAAVGWVPGGKKGAVIGALLGAVGSGLYASGLGSADLSPGGSMVRASIICAALGCGLMAGFFFTFSAVVMESLARQPSDAGVATMQTINVVVFNPWFATAFVATPVACALVMIHSLMQGRGPGAVYASIGSALYLIGTLAVTVFFNVPRNDALAEVAPTAPEAAALWSTYLREWTRWNHVRTAAALAAAGLLTVALVTNLG